MNSTYMATRPCFNSTQRRRSKYSWSASSKRPRGSQNPSGIWTPSSLPYAAFPAAPASAVVWATGVFVLVVNAAAEPARRVAIRSFMVRLLVWVFVLEIWMTFGVKSKLEIVRVLKDEKRRSILGRQQGRQGRRRRRRRSHYCIRGRSSSNTQCISLRNIVSVSCQYMLFVFLFVLLWKLKTVSSNMSRTGCRDQINAPRKGFFCRRFVLSFSLLFDRAVMVYYPIMKQGP